MSTRNEQFLAAAHSIGMRLCRDAIWAGDRCNWIGASMEYVANNWQTVQKAFGSELYAGTSGIGLFLAELDAVAPESIFRKTAQAAFATALSRASELPVEMGIGFYSGHTGIGYALIRAGELLDRADYTSSGLEMLERLREDTLERQGTDVVSGFAGAIPAFLAMSHKFQREDLTALAVRCGDRLIATAHPAEAGWSWDTLGPASPPGQKHLCGFSHGTGGIGWAFLELVRVTSEKRFRDAADRAFGYERHWYNPTYENWPDFRSATPGQPSATPSYAAAWCHGAPGIGLSRVRAFELTGEAAFRVEAEAALRTTERGLQAALTTNHANYSLCHGNFGNAELCLQAARVFGKPEHRTLAEDVALHALGIYGPGLAPWPCGVLNAGETPNLMLGTAGIGHFLLRLHDPARTPAVMIILPD
jgi:lantibiotic modifying enzyme